MNTSSQELLIVDFDRTVFNSDALYRDLYELCEARGISRDFLDPSLALVPPGNLLFNFFLMIQRSQRIESARIGKVVAEMQSYVREKGHLYVFDDSRPFLGSAIKAGWKVAILTHGDLSFQLAKFVGSKLSDLCHSFTVTSEDKWRQMEIMGASPIIFLDDNPKNIDEVKTRFPEALVVEVKRPNTKYQTVLSNKADLIVSRLDWPLGLRKPG
ncbi:MAG: hypothetical protein UT32_C0001G0004 [Parcubacteria group bacterium GW2011_GWC2_39_14]|nr:MAG: hypothetical protein UT32_C0001G0004 [Parcubacteria group bacterium GW2011_GWC2_39_14]KKR55429.1 MAG: hypothetical protein UT91_C0001G0004 [Parcubacteria group bacterium GW2011_GWA2_40_23]